MKLKFLPLLLLAGLFACNGSDSENTIEIYISTGESQCQNDGLTISTTKGYLLEVGIEVQAESCGMLTNVGFPAACGLATGKIHVFTIDKSDSVLAENIGFTIPDDLSADDDYEKLACEN